MADYRHETRRAAQRHGFDPSILERQVGAESNFDPAAVSPAGAIGIAQIMPATAAGWKVDPHNPRAALDAMAKNMAKYTRQFGSVKAALVAYNAGPGAAAHYVRGGKIPAETSAYIAKIMGGKADSGVASAASNYLTARTTKGTAPTVTAARTVADPAEATRLAFSKAPDPASGHLPGLGAGALSTRQSLLASGAATRDIPASYQAGTEPQAVLTSHSTVRGAQRAAGGLSVDSSGGSIRITGANPGRVKPAALHFARQVSSIAGEPLSGDSGATHSRLTVDGNISQHASGDAIDIPATGARLIRLGQAALIAAGMPEKQARKQRGGLYNVGGRQIIFNTHQGGDHTTHLHLGD